MGERDEAKQIGSRKLVSFREGFIRVLDHLVGGEFGEDLLKVALHEVVGCGRVVKAIWAVAVLLSRLKLLVVMVSTKVILVIVIIVVGEMHGQTGITLWLIIFTATNGN